MSLPFFFLRTAFNHLRRGEQRALAALLCITFGVMSLVAMSLVAHTLDRAVVVSPAALIGGDLNLTRQAENFILDEHIAELEALRQAGVITRYTIAAHTSSLVFHRPESGELQFVDTGLGIDPAAYPVVGTLTIDPPGVLTDLLASPGGLLVTRDLADAHGLRVGETLVLADLDGGVSVNATVRGIVTDTPNHQGGKFYYSLATAEQLAGVGGQNQARALDLALALAPDPQALAAQLANQGWQVLTAELVAQSNDESRALMDLLLKGAGILGLLVGGISIANTMQVLLRRRQREIAVWKTLGYHAWQLQALFVTEAALLGAAGSALGAGLGVLVSRGLLDILSRTGHILLYWSFSPRVIATGALVGLTTTVIFALWAIVRAARVAPMALLRNETPAAGRLPWLQSVGLAAALAVPFAAMTSWVMGSPLKGVGVLLFALAGLVGLGALLGGLAWIVVRLMSLPGWPLLRLAQSSLRRRGLGLVFAMIALFTGVAALACGVVITENGQREMAERTITLDGPDINVLAAAGEEPALRAALADQGLDAANVSYVTSVNTIEAVGQPGHAIIAPQLVGRASPPAKGVTGAPWGSAPDGVYIYQLSQFPAGTQVRVTLWDGTTHTLTVVGAYRTDFNSPRPAFGLVMPAALSLRLASPDTVQFDLEAAPGAVVGVSRRLGAALPQATTINLVAHAARFTQVYYNLFVLAVAMSGLALLAGVLLVANAVSLAMLDRRYEIGVLKAIGYTRAHLLATLSMEYGLVAVIATGAALVGVRVLLWGLGLANPLAARLLLLEPGTAALIALTGVGLILLTVLAATWGPTRVSPAIVLNDRE